MTFTKTLFSFAVDGKPNRFSIYHNLPDVPGLSIFDAFWGWASRTQEHTDTNFVEYIRGKLTGSPCFTETEWAELQEAGK